MPAREGAAVSRVFDRPAVVRDVSRHARLGVAPSLTSDLAVLADLARAGLAGIPDAVGGVHVARPALLERIDGALRSSRLVQVRGLAGSGKSVVLRTHAGRALGGGAALFLRGDQLEGRSWRAFAMSVGLSTAPLRSLLAEVGATGTPVLYVDGVDRIELAQQPVVAELFGLLASDPDLADRRVVVTGPTRLLKAYFHPPVAACPNVPVSTFAPSRRKSRCSDQWRIMRTRSSQYSPRV